MHRLAGGHLCGGGFFWRLVQGSETLTGDDEGGDTAFS